jgi:transposase
MTAPNGGMRGRMHAPSRPPPARDSSPLCVIGIDDWAWKRGQRYGSIFCDLERRRVVDLLPDGEPGTVEAWLPRHPEIAVISRDRGGSYGRAAARVAPQAVQVADRWHLMENASAAFLEAVRRSMRPIRIALGAGGDEHYRWARMLTYPARWSPDLG